MTNKTGDTMKVDKTAKAYPYGLGLGLGCSQGAAIGIMQGSVTLSLIIASVIAIAVIGFEKHRMKNKN